MVHAANKERYSLRNRLAITERVSLEMVDRPSHIPPYVFMSPEDEDDIRDIGKHDFPSVPLRPMLRTVPTIVTAHTFCASPDTQISYRQCLLIQGYFCAV